MGSHQIVTETEQFQNRAGERVETEHLHYVKGYRVFMLQAITGFFHFVSLASATVRKKHQALFHNLK